MIYMFMRLTVYEAYKLKSSCCNLISLSDGVGSGYCYKLNSSCSNHYDPSLPLAASEGYLYRLVNHN